MSSISSSRFGALCDDDNARCLADTPFELNAESQEEERHEIFKVMLYI
jgi:hypothetical protein